MGTRGGSDISTCFKVNVGEHCGTLDRPCQIRVQYRIYPNSPLFPRHHMRVWDIENSSNALVAMWGRNHDGAAEPSSAGFVAY